MLRRNKPAEKVFLQTILLEQSFLQGLLKLFFVEGSCIEYWVIFKYRAFVDNHLTLFSEKCAG